MMVTAFPFPKKSAGYTSLFWVVGIFWERKCRTIIPDKNSQRHLQYAGGMTGFPEMASLVDASPMVQKQISLPYWELGNC